MTAQTKDRLASLAMFLLLAPGWLWTSWVVATMWAWFLAGPTGVHVEQSAVVGLLVIRTMLRLKDSGEKADSVELLHSTLMVTWLAPATLLPLAWVARLLLP